MRRKRSPDAIYNHVISALRVEVFEGFLSSSRLDALAGLVCDTGLFAELQGIEGTVVCCWGVLSEGLFIGNVGVEPVTVSYTHLTLPTIYSV